MQIKFVTINILHGGKIWDNLIEFIHQQKPDILALQEVFDSHDKNLEKRYRTMDEFKKEFPWLSYSAFSPTVIDLKSQTPWGNAIFSKFKIKSFTNHIFNPPLIEYDLIFDDPNPTRVPEGMLEAQLQINNKEVSVFSWHGLWGKDGYDNPERTEMGKIIIKNIKDKSLVILAGDSNLLPTTQVVAEIEKYLVNVFGNSLPSTFNMKHKTNPVYATVAVDMAFVSKDFKIISKEMPMVDISDHMPLVVELEI